jgi:hypothetical protein
MYSRYFYPIISIFISIFSYFFCKYISEIVLVRLPFVSKKIKMDRNCKNIIKFTSNFVNKKNILLDEQYFIKNPKYFVFSNELFYKNINNNIKDKISNFINEALFLSSIFAFLNNKFILSLLYKEIKKSDFSSILNVFYNFKYPINIILKFYYNNDFVLFYIKNNTIIKINNCETYNKIIDFVLNSDIFAICDDKDNIYISNGFIINYNINEFILSNIFGNNINNKYFQSLNKFYNLDIICVSSTNNTLNPF